MIIFLVSTLIALIAIKYLDDFIIEETKKFEDWRTYNQKKEKE